MRIKVPLEVALVICAGVIALLVILGMGSFASWLEKKFSAGTVKWAVRVLGLIFAGAGIFIATSFYLEQDQYDPVYRGLERFGLGEVVLAAILLGAAGLCWFWSRLRLPAVLETSLSGVAIVLKPILWPLLRDRNNEPYDLTSETHLYFVLSGLGLVGLGVILFFRQRFLRNQQQPGPRLPG